MALVVPKIIWPHSGGSTLLFDYPPRNQPYDERVAVRHDNISSAGVRESIYERTDTYLNLEIEYSKTANMAQWDSFIQYAEQGGSFDFYPDSTLGASTQYLLEGTSWTAAYKQIGMFTFTVRLYLYPGWP